MFIPFISTFKIILRSKLPVYYFSQVIIPSLVLVLRKFTTTTNNMIYTFILFSTHSTQRISLSLTRFVLILWFWAVTIRLCLPFRISILKPSSTHDFLLLYSASNTDHVELSATNLLIFSLSLIYSKHLQLLNHLSCLL